MKKYDVRSESWGLLQGEKYHKSATPAALRFRFQSDVVVITKYTHKECMLENISVFGFELSKEDMDKIRGLDEKKSAFFSYYDPDTVEFLTGLGK